MDKDEYFLANMQGAKILCLTCETNSLGKLTFTSSVTVYGFAKLGTNGRVS